MTLSDYRKTWRGLQFGLLSLPLLAAGLEHKSPVPFPPVGDNPLMWRFAALSFGFVAGLLPFLFAKRGKRAPILTSLGMVVAGALMYLWLQDSYVVAINYPDAETRFVTRGEVRVIGLREPYASMNDDDLIRHAGQTDTSLRRIYTSESIRAVRWKLFGSYIVWFCGLEFLLGCVAIEKTSR